MAINPVASCVAASSLAPGISSQGSALTEEPCGQEKQHKRYEVVPRKSEAMDEPEMSPLGSCHHLSLYMSNGRKQIHEHEEDHPARGARDHEPCAGPMSTR